MVVPELMRAAREGIDSAVPDLASNPRHVADFGSDRRHRLGLADGAKVSRRELDPLVNQARA
jgi:hypothetical protein